MRVFLYLLVIFFLTPPTWANVRFLNISDIHYGSDNTPGDGHDTDVALLASSLNKFSHLANEVDFILTLGDFATHGIKSSTKKAEYISTVFHGLYKADIAAKPMFYITGNNDSLRGNYQPFSWEGKSPLTFAKDWQGSCAHCKDLIIDGKHMQDEGYYLSYVLPGNKDIILIALNTTPFAKAPFFTLPYPNKDRDASKQLLWLEKQLKTHHAKQLLIAMHIPPGNNYHGSKTWQKKYLKQFIHLLNVFHENYEQVTLLTAHTHMDDVRKIHLSDGTNIYAYATPSVSRIHYNYPAMKIFDLDTDMRVKDYTTYYSTKENQWADKYYQFTKHIFPQCNNQTLDKCQDLLTNEHICKTLKTGLFYGAKNPKVNSSVCKITYMIN